MSCINLASDVDPGTTGYVVVVAVNSQGCPTNFNYLIGDKYVKLSTGHAANPGAEALSALAGGLPLCNDGSISNAAPSSLAVASCDRPHAIDMRCRSS